MPKGKKTCPKCGLETGARMTECGCGHQFSSTAKKVSQTKVSQTNSNPEKIKTTPTPTPAPSATPNISEIKRSIQSPIIYGPAGKCPCKPEGYQKGWPNGPASKEVVQDWIYRVLSSSNRNYSPHAIIYWAGQFWDVNGPNLGEDFKRVRSIIIDTLVLEEKDKLEFVL